MTTATTVQVAPHGARAPLLVLLERQRAEYRALRDMSRQQHDYVARRDGEALLTLLGRRQQGIERLTEIDAALSQYRRDWGQVYASLEPADRERADTLLGEINETLAAIMASDREDAEELGEQKQRISGELASVPTSRQVHRAYGAAAAPASQYFDQTEGLR